MVRSACSWAPGRTCVKASAPSSRSARPSFQGGSPRTCRPPILGGKTSWRRLERLPDLHPDDAGADRDRVNARADRGRALDEAVGLAVVVEEVLGERLDPP